MTAAWAGLGAVGFGVLSTAVEAGLARSAQLRQASVLLRPSNYLAPRRERFHSCI